LTKVGKVQEQNRRKEFKLQLEILRSDLRAENIKFLSVLEEEALILHKSSYSYQIHDKVKCNERPTCLGVDAHDVEDI
jgi:hypothetical protein